jgi:hypothetical protein
MSRCFPYPPPGYYPKGERKEALIESSIKLQKEKEKAKAERKKERHREKKEKKREIKVKDTSEFGHGEKRKREHKDEKSRKGEKDRTDVETKYIEKRREDEAEQLERSNLTEEHGQPVSLQNPCYSSDSTENSNKRRRQESPVNGIRCTHGNILRIRLPSLKIKEPEVDEEKIYAPSKPIREELRSLKLKEPVVDEEKIYSSRKPIREELRSLKLKEPVVSEEKLYSFSKPIQEELRSVVTDVCKHGEEQICSTSGGPGISAQGKLCDAKASTSKSGIPTVESLFKDLVENWVSPPIQSERTDLDELEWLFGRKHPGRERAKVSSDISCTGSANLLPRAQYLPEADIYALPFTVPF